MLFRIALVSIGNEVLSGDTLNTNVRWLAEQCTALGAVIAEHRTISDDIAGIVETIAELRQRCELVITTGGLGPTHDDRTVAAMLELFADELVLHQPTLEHIERLVAERGRAMTERLRMQAMVPASATVLPNRVGSAPGLLFDRSDGAAVIVLPGVPREMEHIMLESGLRWIAERIASGGYEIIAEHVFVTAGVPEADLADRLEPLRTQLPPTVELAFLPSASGVRIRVRARGRPDAVRLLLDQAVEPLRAALGSAIVSENNERLVEVLQRECIARGKTVAVAESCTGGMLGMEITSVPGSSAYFLGGLICYADAVKIHFGGVRPETIARYGAVSQQTVEELAAYIRAAYGSDLAVAISGIAGPGGGTAEKPVGTVWIAVADGYKVVARQFQFGSDRHTVRARSCAAAMLMLLERLRTDERSTQ
jgi:nicotinamide-nucleotide amidase